MRAVIQRVSKAHVTVAGEVVGQIGPGVLVFLGVGKEDSQADADWLVRRIVKLRIFESEPGRMNESLLDICGQALVISQFTLFGSLKKGNRPSFNRAALPEQAVPLYEYFVTRLRQDLGQTVAAGVFGAHMDIEAQNDGPITLVVDTQERDF
ncbi:D-aminoacyl-tRNA deacylase [Coraliomargarita algicola]|uniref:D-aminoacyl-tRNA deacylase n=1 Tax=Coraliomargarita algicola TaxID=3092156 RepID=A0ABZ0RFF5_9BACT|nr:D-aminoacyl-tRNA deacylase [Coraliomargarita sp. J2-16]WPJ94233.1 D-aminoacyl-tRNA deacylase [Coraliomargarita sp. J2-16]